MFLVAATITNLKASFPFLYIVIKQKKFLKFPVIFCILCIQGYHTGVLVEFSKQCF